jgi:hypothetical protein
MKSEKLKMEAKLAQNNANPIQSNNKYQQQLQFEDPNDEIFKNIIEIYTKKMQAEEQKISNL